MDEQEIQRLFEELQRAVEEEAAQKRVLGRTSEATRNQIENLRDRIEDSGVSLKKLTNETDQRADSEKQAGQEIKQAGQSVVNSFAGLARTLAQGNATFSTFGSTIGDITTAAAATSTALGTLAAGPLGGLIGGAIGLSIKGLGASAEFAASRLDETVPIYQSLGSVGATTAEGFDGLLAQLDRTGGVSFPAFQRSVLASSVGLAALEGTTARGASRLAETFGELSNRNTELGRRLLSLGFSVDEIGERTAEFITTQTLFSARQARSERDLAGASADYLEQLDRLARVTGASRQQQEEVRRAALADARFRARINSMLRSGDEQQIQAARNLQALNEGLAATPEAAAAFRASVTGIPLSEAAQGAFVGLQGAFTEVGQQIQAGTLTAEQGFQRITRAADGFESRFNPLLQFVGSDAFGSVTTDLQTLSQFYRDDIDITKAAQSEQQKLTGSTGTVTDRLNTFQIDIANASNEVKRLGNDLIDPTLPALQSFASVTADAATGLRNVVGNFVDTSYRQLDLLQDYQRTVQSQLTTSAPNTTAANNVPAPTSTDVATTQTPTVSPVVQEITADTLNTSLNNLVNVMGQSTINQAQLAQAQQDMTASLADYTASRPGESVFDADIIMRNIRAARSQIPASGMAMSPENLKLMIGSGTVPTFASGGITAGPSIAGEAGPEAVVPLPDGRSIPIQMPDYTASLSTEFSNNTGAMMDRFEKTTQQMLNTFSQEATAENKQQLARLDASVTNLQQLVTLMKDQNSVTNKLLQVSRN